jgi:hypothetical protein
MRRSRGRLTLGVHKIRFLSSPHQERNDTEIRDEKRDMMFAHGQRERAEQARFAPSKTSQRLNHGAP